MKKNKIGIEELAFFARYLLNFFVIGSIGGFVTIGAYIVSLELGGNTVFGSMFGAGFMCILIGYLMGFDTDGE